MKHLCFLLLSLAVLTSLYAQDLSSLSAGQITAARNALSEKREAIVSLTMDLSPKEADVFWPLYREYRGKAAILGDRELSVITKIDRDYNRLSDSEIKSLEEEWLAFKADDLKLKKEYLKKFRKVLPESKVARLFQLENKLDVLARVDLANTIPLIESATK